MSRFQAARLAAAIFLVFSVVLTATVSEVLAQSPAGRDIMELARRRYVDGLVYQKNYKTGKFSATGIPELGEKKPLLELDGPGEVTRIWTTLSNKQDVMHLAIYVDEETEPVLSGITRELAAAAQQFSCPAVPWGGFLDGYSVSLYLPIPFQRHLRVVAQYEDKIEDGPYWQIDYKLCADPGPPAWRQQNGPEGIKFIPTDGNAGQEKAESRDYQILRREVEVSFHPVDILLDGPAVIRGIHITSNYLNNFALRLAFDAEGGYADPASRVDHVNFQVDVPLKYLVSNFYTAGVQLHGTTASIYFPMPVKKQALLQLQNTMEEKGFHTALPATVVVEYEKAPQDIGQMYYFHAAASTEVTNGYRDFEVLGVRGEGHFVGVNLFDTNHDHGGGENIFFDAGTDNAGQLHGICGEDYFHHAYMRIGVSAPYTHCPTHSARCRHHLEMPIPFRKSFTFNWGCFAGAVPKAVAIWYQKELSVPAAPEELTYQVTGPFRLSSFDELSPGRPLPDSVYVRTRNKEFLRQTWSHIAQNGFVDLCHAFRRYSGTISPYYGHLDFDCCFVAEAKVWAARNARTRFLIGCDDRIRVYLNGSLIGQDPGRNRHDPFEQFSADAALQAGVNTIRVVVANTRNWNWEWNGFSLVMENDLGDGQMYYMY